MSLIDGYIEARKVTEFDDFRDLLVSDRLKVALKPTVLMYRICICVFFAVTRIARAVIVYFACGRTTHW